MSGGNKKLFNDYMLAIILFLVKYHRKKINYSILYYSILIILNKKKVFFGETFKLPETEAPVTSGE